MLKTHQASLYLKFAHIGGALTLALLAALVLEAPKSILMGLMLGVMVFSLLLFRRRMRDEYVEGLWAAGTDVSFLTVVLLTLFGDFVHGVIDGIRDGAGGAQQAASASPLDNPSLVGLLALAAFYIGFHIAMLKERA